MLEPDLLRAFVAVADTLSFTRAAQRLNRTQAAISTQIRRLEERLDLRLFHRSTAHVELTERGEILLIDARRMLSLHDATVARLTGQGDDIHLRLAIMEDYGTRYLPSILAQIAVDYPRARIDVEVGLTAQLLRRLDRSFDAVVAMHGTGASEGELLCQEEAVWVASNLAKPEHADVLPVAFSNPDCLFRRWGSDALDQSHRPWRVAYVSPSFAAVEAIVEQGLAVGVMKASLVTPQLRRLNAEQLPTLPSAEIRLHRADHLGPRANDVIDQIAAGIRRTARPR